MRCRWHPRLSAGTPWAAVLSPCCRQTQACWMNTTLMTSSGLKTKRYYSSHSNFCQKQPLIQCTPLNITCFTTTWFFILVLATSSHSIELNRVLKSKYRRSSSFPDHSVYQSNAPLWIERTISSLDPRQKINKYISKQSDHSSKPFRITMLAAVYHAILIKNVATHQVISANPTLTQNHACQTWWLKAQTHCKWPVRINFVKIRIINPWTRHTCVPSIILIRACFLRYH